MSLDRQGNQTSFGSMLVSGDYSSPLPLKHTHISGKAVGPFLELTYTQVFINPFQHPIDITYLFPLHPNAAVLDFEIRTGSKTIKSAIVESKDAQQAFESARISGQTAGIISQTSLNLFSVKLSGIAPSKGLAAQVRIFQKLDFKDGFFEIVIPMGITPRYSGKLADRNQPGLPPIEPDPQLVGTVELSLDVEAGLLIGTPECPSHKILITDQQETSFKTKLQKPEIPNRDFVLRFPVTPNQPTANLWLSESDPKERYFLLSFVPPRLPGKIDAAPREFIFALDRSGSMRGKPLTQAKNALKACLRTLNQGDTFRILAFDEITDWFEPEGSPVNQQTIQWAEAFLDQIDGRSGTDIILALESALKIPPNPSRLRFVVFLTDGAVTAEEKAVRKVQKLVGAARVFTFGIGPSVNRGLLDILARMGRGKAEFIGLEEDIEGAILRFQDQVTFPALTNIHLDWKKVRPTDIYPEPIPDLFYGTPLELCGHFQGEFSPANPVVVYGQTNSEQADWSSEINASPVQCEFPALIWAQNRIRHLLETSPSKTMPDSIRKEIIRIALKYQLITPLTSMLTIDQHGIADNSNPVSVEITHPLPDGLDLRYLIPIPEKEKGLTNTSKGFNSLVNRLIKRPEQATTGTPAPPPPEPQSPQQAQSPQVDDSPYESTLRELARTQNMDGSWSEDPLLTAGAILAFLRSGHTTQVGIFRAQIRKGVEWITTTTTTGINSFIRAAILYELASSTGLEEHEVLTRMFILRLSKPTQEGEQAILDYLKQNPIHLSDEFIKNPDNFPVLALLSPRLNLGKTDLQENAQLFTRVWHICKTT